MEGKSMPAGCIENEDSLDDRPEFNEFCNHIWLGQWELACASIKILLSHSSHSSWKEQTIATLKSIAAYPEKACISFLEIPSPANLSWQCCVLLEEICGMQDEEVSHLKRDAEFTMMLQDALHDVPQHLLQHIYDIFADVAHYSSTSLGASFTEECLVVLRNKLLESPLPVHSVLLCILSMTNSYRSKTVKEQIYQLYMQCLWNLVNQLPNPDISESKVSELEEKLLVFLSIMPDMPEESTKDTTKSLQDFVIQLVELTHSDVLETKQVYGALLSRTTLNLLHYYCEKEDIIHQRMDGGGNNFASSWLLPENVGSDSDGTINFHEMFLCTIKQKRHFLESFLNEVICHLHEGREQTAWELLETPFLCNLHLFALVLAFQSAVTDENADNVMQAMESWIPKMSPTDPGLKALMCKLKYYLLVTKWCINKLQSCNSEAKDFDVRNKARTIFSRLQRESVISVIHGMIGHQRISKDELLQLLSNQTSDILGFSESDCKFLELTNCQNSMIYKGCLAIQHAMEAIKHAHELECESFKDVSQELVLYELSKSHHGSTVDRIWTNEVKSKDALLKTRYESKYKELVTPELEKCKQVLDQLYPLKFRVEILEDVFSLMFVTSAELTNVGVPSTELDDYGGDFTVIEPSSSYDISLMFRSSNLESLRPSSHLMQAQFLSSSSSGSGSNLIASGGGDDDGVKSVDKLAKRFRQAVIRKPSRSKNSRIRRSSLTTLGSDSSKSSSVPKFEFLCNDRIVLDLLDCLETVTKRTHVLHGIISSCLLDIENGMEVPEDKMATVGNEVTFRKLIISSVNDDTIKARLNQLIENISSAQCRYELIMSNETAGPSDIADSNSKVQDMPSTSYLKEPSPYLRVNGAETLKEVTSDVRNLTAKLFQSGEHRPGHIREVCRFQLQRETHPGIISQMLASPDMLLRHFLIQRKISQAVQVKELFKLSDTPEVKELCFTTSISSTVKTLKELTQFKRSHYTSVIELSRPVERKLVLGSQSPLSLEIAAVAEAAALGKEVTKVGAILGNLFSTTQISLISEAKELKEPSIISKYPFLSQIKNARPLVLADLSYSEGLSLDLSKTLLEMALQQDGSDEFQHEPKEQHSSHRRSSVSNIKGIFKTCLQIREFIMEIQKLENALDKMDSTYATMHPAFLPQSTLTGIVSLSEDPLEAALLRESVSGWQKLISSLCELQTLLQSGETGGSGASPTSETKSSLKTLSTLENRNLIHVAYSRLRKICLGELKYFLANFSGSSEGPQYMKALYKHVQRVCKALLHCRTQSTSTASPRIVYTSYFSVLEDNPSEVLATLILKEGVPPKTLEEFAQEMKVNLLNVIIESSCPSIPCSVTLPMLAEEIQEGKQHEGHQVLGTVTSNNSVFDEDCAKALYADQEWKEWVLNSSELAHVNLDVMHENAEKIAFFSNLSNIMMVHGLIWEIGNKQQRNEERFAVKAGNSPRVRLLSPYFSEQLVYMKVVGYHVGQIGFLSLYDLKFNLLRYGRALPPRISESPLQFLSDVDRKDFSKYAPNPDPRLHFTQIEGCTTSPRLQVLYVDGLTHQLDSSTTEFLMKYVTLDVPTRTIILPELLSLFSEDFVIEDQDMVKQIPFEGLVNLVTSNLIGDLQAQVLELLKITTVEECLEVNDDSSVEASENFKVEFQPKSRKFGIVFEYEDSSETNFAEDVSSRKFSISSMYFTPEVIGYLKSKSWILIEFLKLIGIGKFEDLERSPPTSPEAIGIIKDSDPISQLVSWLLKLKAHACGEEDSTPSSEWIVPMLAPFCNTNFIWSILDVCVFSKLCLPAIEFIDYIVQTNPDCNWNDYLLIRECLLCQLASEKEFPWTFSLRINDIYLKVSCILSNLASWQDSVCQKVLRACISECSQRNLPDIMSMLKRKMKEIDVCQKILQAKNIKAISLGDIFEFETWRDVVDESRNSPQKILYLLKRTKQFQLSKEWSELYPVPEDCDVLVKEMFLLSLLEEEPPDKDKISEVSPRLRWSFIDEVLLSVTDTAKCVHLCNNLITQTQQFSSKLMLLDILKKHFFATLTEIIPEHTTLEIGLKMMLCVPEGVRHLYEDLILHPAILFEQLLMNMEIKAAEQIVKTDAFENESRESSELVPLSVINTLLERYARKSIEFPLIPDIPDKESLTSSTDYVSLISADEYQIPPTVPKKEDWIPDEKVSCCLVCNVEQFSMFCRRHHCRRCGRVVCASCSAYTLVLDEYGSVPVRACRDCYLHTQNRRLSEASPSVALPSDARLKLVKRHSLSSSPRYFREKSEGRTSRASTISGDRLLQYTLSTDPQQNESILNDFYYQQAPSVSLCLSLLNLHSDTIKAANCILDFCNILIKSLKPKLSGKPNKEVDYGLVISMMKTLLLNAKMKFMEKEDGKGISKTDMYLSRLDLINILVTSNCKQLIPIGDLTKIETIRKLRDELLEEERFALALEICTKCGLETSIIYHKWGLICLKTGCWKLAREKFSYCLQKTKDLKQSKPTNHLLDEILNCLENSRCSGGIKATDVHRRISNLKNIQSGATRMHSKKDDLDPFVLMECLYYLKAYGSPLSLIAFYQRHKMLSEALQYIVSEGCVPDVFIEGLLLPSLKSGQLSSLLSKIRQVDPALTQWKFYLISACRYMHHHRLRHVLYQVQVFMEDYLRAAMSCIHFYTASAQSYRELNNRVAHLSKAVSHYEEYLKQYGTTGKPSSKSLDAKLKQNIMIQSQEEVERHKNAALLQISITKVLNKPGAERTLALLEWEDDDDRGAHDIGKNEPFVLPTLFENNKYQIKMAAVVALTENSIEEGMPLTNKIIKVVGLAGFEVYRLIGKMLVHAKRNEEITHFLAYLYNHQLVESSAYDDIIVTCIRAILHHQGTAEDVEYLVKMMHSDVNKISGYLQCGKLRAAYLLAMQMGSVEEVKKVMAAAEKMGQEAVRKICEKWLQNESRLHQSKS